MEQQDLDLWKQAAERPYICFEQETAKTILLDGFKLHIKEKEYEGKKKEYIVLEAPVIEEDGDKVEKTLETHSRPLLEKLRPHLEPQGYSSDHRFLFKITRFGSGNKTRYMVELLEHMPNNDNGA